MFITDTDYDATIHTEILGVLTRNNPTVKQTAEREAIGLASSYLNGKFDCATIFNQTGDNRNPVILMFVKDIAIYNMHSIHNPRAIPDIRVKRYDDAIEWLKSLNKDQANPVNLERSTNKYKDDIQYGSNPKRQNHF